MNIRGLLLGTAACAILAAPAFAQDSNAPADQPKKHHRHHDADAPVGSDRLDRLERLVEQQSQEIQDLKAQVNQNQAPSQVSSEQFEALQNQLYETQASVKAATTPHDKKLHFKGVTVTFGGFAAAESVYRSRNEESDIGSSYAKIPFAGPGSLGNSEGNAVAIGHTAEWRQSERQSRVSALVEGDFDPNTHFTYYGEFDFLGAAASANSNESNSYTPRVRNLYGTVDWSDIGLEFLYGQSWSLVTLDTKGMSERSEAPPPTIDAQYVPGFNWTRQPQLRVVKQLGDDFWIGFSAENPQTTIAGGAPTVGTGAGNLVGLTTDTGNSFSTAGLNGSADAEFNPGIQLSLNHVPDFIGKVAWEPDFLGGNVHLEGFGIYRDFYNRFGVVSTACAGTTSTDVTCQLASVTNHDVSGGGGGVSALIKLIPGLFDIQADAMFGSGIGRYGSGQLSDVTYNASGTFHPLTENMEMVGGTLHATSALDLYVYAGREHEDAAFFGASGGYGNPNIASAYAGCMTFDTTSGCSAGKNLQDVEQITVGLWDKAYQGDFGNFRIGLQYSYTYLKALPGETGSGLSTLEQPHTSDNMFFTSFRWYPF